MVLLSVACGAMSAGDVGAPSLRGGAASPGADAAAREGLRQGVGGAPSAAADQAASAESAAPAPEGPLSGNASAVALEMRPLVLAGGWSQGGDKMWGSGAGVESINAGNVGYYNQGMDAAHARCGGSGCALMVNPPGHRTVNEFHIHFVHFASYGADLKRKMEGMVCGKSGWHSGSLPCGGRAAYFPGFPGVFSQAMSAGSIAHASVIAWPAACGGSGTIVELAYGCSIEHQIRGDYNPNYR